MLSMSCCNTTTRSNRSRRFDQPMCQLRRRGAGDGCLPGRSTSNGSAPPDLVHQMIGQRFGGDLDLVSAQGGGVVYSSTGITTFIRSSSSTQRA